MAGHEWEDWFEREEFIGQISDMRVQNLQVEREVVQKRTFTRWINLHLEKCDPPIEVHDLFRDIQDGHILMALLEELSGCKLLHGFKKSSHRIFRLNNIAKVLSFLEERNVKLVSIDAADVADGNSSIILGLIWNIILFFQIKELTGNIRSQFPSSCSLSSIPTSSDSDTTFCSTASDERQSVSTAMREHSKAIKKLLQWVQKRTRKFGVAVQDFAKSWTSGLAFLAIIKSIDPSLVDMRKSLLRPARENLEEAFRIAHYSLGIPRLLEPEDVTINTPDEQSIITYVTQFLEHFPGLEMPDEPCQLIERSISMCRLNNRNSDHVRNGAHGSRVKERSYMFLRDCTQSPPKILISDVSEDRCSLSRPFRTAAARLWSSEDFLTESSHMEDISSNSVVEEPKETASEVLFSSTSNSPQLSYTHSLTGSSVPESVNTESLIGDSAISSPDSWVESEFGIMPEKFCESQSDSSLCDSGTAWDVYRATPVEITTLDEEFVPSTENRVPDEKSTTESYIDEGIYSLSSLESTQERMQGPSVENPAEVMSKKETNLENHNHDKELKQVTDHRGAKITEEADLKEADTSLLQKDDLLRKGESSFEVCDAEPLAHSGFEDLIEPEKNNPFRVICKNKLPPPDQFEEVIKHTSVEESASGKPQCLKKAVDYIGDTQGHEGQINSQTESQKDGNICKEVKVEAEFQNTVIPPEDTKVELRKEKDERVVKTQDKTNEDVLGDCPNPQESFSTNTHPMNQDMSSKNSMNPSTAINIPLISISIEPEEQVEGRICDPERQDQAGDDQATVSKGSDTDYNSPQKSDEMNCDTSDKKKVEMPSCQVSENVSEKIGDIQSGLLDDRDTHHSNRSSNADIFWPNAMDNRERSEAKQEWSSQHTSPNLIIQTSSTDGKSHPVKTEQGTDPVDGHQDERDDTFSDCGTTQQNTLNPVNSTHNDDLVSHPIEPMDLFYPDKEEPMFTEQINTEDKSWPSVLSVSALQPAPASETLLNEESLNLLDKESRNRLDSIQEHEKVIIETNQKTDKASESQEQCLLPVERIGALWGGDVPADGSNFREAEHQSSNSARENTVSVSSDTKSSSRCNESQIPPVLRHRKGLCINQPMENQTVATRKTDSGSSEFWWSDSSELYLLLLLWLLLYCFWLLPQMDLKTLPSLLLNL